ncbi:MAG: hypothetical protein ABI417_01595 [Coleofasciculaceae cyanobacterium]
MALFRYSFVCNHTGDVRWWRIYSAAIDFQRPTTAAEASQEVLPEPYGWRQ